MPERLFAVAGTKRFRVIPYVHNGTRNFEEIYIHYYPRIANDRLGGRVTRLFVTPFLWALSKILGAINYLEFMDSFRYPLSGEFSLRKDLLKTLRIPGDWGLVECVSADNEF